jgi:hypothetical protein
MKPLRFFGNGRQAGATVAGLLLCLAAAGALAALAIPLHDRARDAASLASTLADMRGWNRAFQAYIAAKGAAPDSPLGPMVFKKRIVEELAPYMDQYRTLDWWGYNYRIWTGPGALEYGIRLEGARDYLLTSTGKGGIRETWTYDPARPEAGLYDISAPEDYEKDVVIWNGRLVRGPRRPK